MHILIMESHRGVRELLADVLQLWGYQVTQEQSHALGTCEQYDLLLIEPGNDDAFLLRLLAMQAGVPLVIISCHEAVLQIAWDHQIPRLRKPFRLKELSVVLEQACRTERQLFRGGRQD